MNLTQAYATFAVKPTNIQWSWTARNDDWVVVNTWQDLYVSICEYRFPALDAETGLNSLGFKEMIENLKWAIEHNDCRVKIIISRSAKGPEAGKRETLNSVPRLDLEMKIVSLDEKTGEYVGQICPVV